MSTVTGQGWNLEIQQDLIDATPNEEPDPDWCYVDPAGHEHRYAENFEVPTVKFVETSRWWCFDHDHEVVEGDYRCVQCNAEVVPGMLAVTERRYVAGLTNIVGSLRRGVDGFDQLLVEKKEVELTLTDRENRHLWLTGVRATDASEDEVWFVAAKVMTGATSPPHQSHG